MAEEPDDVCPVTPQELRNIADIKVREDRARLYALAAWLERGRA